MNYVVSRTYRVGKGTRLYIDYFIVFNVDSKEKAIKEVIENLHFPEYENIVAMIAEELTEKVERIA